MQLPRAFSCFRLTKVCGPLCLLWATLAPAIAESRLGPVESALQSRIDSLSGLVTRPAERDALKNYYAGRAYQPVWFDDRGPTRAASEAVKEMTEAETWGLKASDFQLPAAATPLDGGRWTAEQVAAAEFELTAAILRYARHARGGRIGEPEKMLSDFLDRSPALVEPAEVLSRVAQAAHPGEAMRAFHPSHEQFSKLHDLYVKVRGGAKVAVIANIAAKGALLAPGQTHADIALLRRRFKVAAAAGKEEFYDDKLVSAVKAFQESMSLPADGIAGPVTRKALNAEAPDKLQAIVASMEQWRWMPRDLGRTHLLVNVPAFTVNFMQDGVSKLEERVIVGKQDTQTPVFSKDMTAVVLRPSWFLPDSIKLEKLLHAARRGKSIEDEGIIIKKGERVVKSWDVDWDKAELSEYSIFQPSGDGNALGDVKFLFPNKHSVYLHDTPTKKLFEASDRLFSHGCVRLRNPLAMAQLVLDNDKGHGAFNAARLVKDGPGSNQIMLDTPLPMHIGYFTVWVGANGEAHFFADSYGHNERISLALQEKWDAIDKGVDRLAKIVSEHDKGEIAALSTPAQARPRQAQDDGDRPVRQRSRTYVPPQGLINAAESHDDAQKHRNGKGSSVTKVSHKSSYVTELMRSAYVH